MIRLAALGFAAWLWHSLVALTERWGTLPHEPSMPMPGDELIKNPATSATRAVVIYTPPDQVYPWFAQMGPGRAGWYSYDWIDNRGVESAREINPEWVVTGPGVSMGGMAGLRFDIVDAAPGQHLVISVATKGPLAFTMSYLFEPWGAAATRVLVRVRGASEGGRWLDPAIRLALGPGDLVMVRRQLLGVKERAERR
ncbi:MAG: SRPBCC family protein [Acidimicrobiia bacterium]|nr:SRPBCC family protein [Acidimicrobiia bacterium]